MKKLICILLTLALFATFVVPAYAAETTDSTVSAIVPEDGTYVPNQVVVLFKNSAIDVQTRPDKGDLESVGADFGDMMDASSSKNEALSAADEEVDILKKSLGDDFVLEDTLVFDEPKADSKAGESVGASAGADFDELTIALVSSDRYDTATLIQKLSKNKNVAKVEPNYIYKPTSFDDYSLNDEYSSYLYHAFSPAANNTGGDSVENRGADPEAALSINASSAWSKVTDTDKEVVVAVVDSGVLDTHEDLKDVMWTNPGNIGLKGAHGYNFAENKGKTNDTVGHGTHCAGVIAAQANNLKGVAGIGSAANVKIMALQIMSGSFGSSTVYCVIGAYNYIHKAVQGGVNVVGVNNSWGGRGYSTVYDEVIDLLGEDGVVSYYAAANDGLDNDRVNTYPANTESEYAVTVGAADITGQPGKFSDYGKSSVDVFGPGMNILSTVSTPVYYPQLYDAARFNETTDYYGEFNANTAVENGTVTPSVGDKADATVKSFGSLQFVKQTNPGFDVDDTSTEAYPEFSLVHDRHFNSENPYRLKLTIKQAHFGEEYFIYFPFEKDPLTTGDDNTAFSIAAESIPTENGDGEWFRCGEVIRQTDGTLSVFYEGGNGNGINLCRTSRAHDGVVRHITNKDREANVRSVMSAEEADGKLLGLGVYISGGTEPTGAPQDLSMYLDNIAVSKPDVTFDPNTSYDVMSGTSMACPSVTGAGALIAALNPRLDGESGGDYAKRIRTLLLSCSRQTDEFKDICSTGGYIDLSLLGTGAPVITDAVCDVENETITIKGENLFGTLTYRSLTEDGAEDRDLPDSVDIEYSDDGKQLVLTNAKALFSTYTAFTVTAENGMKGEGKFFLVKGQHKLEQVSSYLWQQGQGQAQEPPYLVASADGKQLFGYFLSNARVARFDGSQFNTINNTDLLSSIRDYYAAETGDYYSAYNDYKYEVYTPEVPLHENGMIYSLGSITALQDPSDDENPDDENPDDENPVDENPDDENPDDENPDDENPDDENPDDENPDDGEDPDYDDGTDWYLCRFDLGDAQPHWTFSAIKDVPDQLFSGSFYMYSCFAGGKLYGIAKPLDPKYIPDDPQTSLEMYSLDVTTGEWTQEPDLPAAIEGYDFVSSNGKLYVFGGFTPDDHKTSADERMVNSVYCFDGNNWSQKDDLNIVGRYCILSDSTKARNDAVAQVRNGLLFTDTSVDGGGNVFVYNTDTDQIEPLYYTLNDSVSDAYTYYHSCAVTTDGVYYLRHKTNDNNIGWELSLLPKDSGVYEDPYADIILGDADGDGKVTITDATMIQQYLAEFTMPGTFRLKACDVNRDGFVDIRDVTALQRYVADMSAPAGVGFIMDEVDPLSLWTETAPLKRELIAYVKTVTDSSNPEFIPVKDRIAVFDMDGTLCCETDPGYFDHKLLYHRVMEDPDYKDQASDFEKEVCEEIKTYFETGVYPSGLDVRHGTAVATAFKGMTPDEFDAYVKAYRDTPMESYTNMTNGQAFYKPMLQVVEYLQANDFKVYIVSGTDRLITRGLADGMVNIPLAQMIGSDESLVATGQGDTDGLKYTFTQDDELITGGEFIIKNLKMNKVTAIEREIGLQPVLAFGNSSGDAAMANYTITNNKYKSGAFLLCCDDLERENGNLSKAESMRQSCEQNGWTAVSMKKDWTTIYGDGVQYIKNQS